MDKEKNTDRVKQIKWEWRAGFWSRTWDFEKMVPPGVDYKKEVRYFLCALLFTFLSSMVWFFIRFQDFHRNLYNTADRLGEQIVIEGAMMPDFKLVLGGCLLGFAVLVLCAAAGAGYHYLYYFQGSKSVYLMKRLPKRWELLKRCTVLPAMAVFICLATAFVLLLIYYWYYISNTPPECLAPGQWQKLWAL